MKKRIIGLFAAVLAAAMLFGCGKTDNSDSVDSTGESTGAQSETNDGEKLSIVTTLFYQYDFAKQAVGDKAEVELLLKSGQESHSYEPTPQDVIKIQDADIFIYNGGVAESWVEQVLEGLDTDQVKIICMMDYVDVVEEEIVEGMEDDSDHDEDEHDDEEAEYDEHIWTSPVIAQDLVKAIGEALEESDADNKDYYAENTARYITELEDLDAKFREAAAGGSRTTLVFGDRFPLRYFVEEYGLTYYAAFPGCSTETEPGAGTIAFLTDEMKEEEIPVIYYLELSNEKIADTLCENTGAKKVQFHSCHNVTQEELDSGETYISLMERNVEALREGLE